MGLVLIDMADRSCIESLPGDMEGAIRSGLHYLMKLLKSSLYFEEPVGDIEISAITWFLIMPANILLLFFLMEKCS